MNKSNRTMFLFLEYKGKVTLNPDHHLTIGRTPKNDIVISSLTVSRTHALITFEDNCFVLSDLNSRNGVFLNGALVTKAKLVNGDIIKIGGYQISVHSVDDKRFDDDDTLKEFDTNLSTTIDLRREAYALMVGNVQGDLTSLSIDEIIQILDVNHKTGILSFNGTEEKPIAGCLFFVDGEIVHAILDNQTGEDAAIRLLQINKGTFEFVIEKKTANRSITQSTMWLLYEAHRLRDENTLID